jgi:RND family efflux transporter MFP subunit
MKLEQRSMARVLRLLTVVLALATSNGVLQAQELTAPSVIRAQAEATLSSSVSGPISRLHVDEGESFKAGDILAEVDCAIYQSEAAAARAEADGAMALATSQEVLFSRGGSGQLEVDVAKAEAVAATARAETAELRVETCTIRAPYDGRVVEHAVNTFEYVETGQPMLSIVSSKLPDLEIIAPADWLNWLKPGTRGELRVEASREVFVVSVKAIAPVVDPVSRTVKLTGTFDGDTTGLLPGMSGLITLSRDK